MPYNVVILGASGYTGAELVRLISSHPEFYITALCADRKAGLELHDVYPQFCHLTLPKLSRMEDLSFEGVDLVFAALPHGLSQALVAKLPKHVKVVDLGADFRLSDPASYETWYGAAHIAPELQKTAIYGLSEFYREQIKTARLVAGTGCNAATVQYALRPLISSKVIDLHDIICDLKNGLTGAGRAVKEHMLYTERSSSVLGYAQGGTHRHLGEFDQEFSALAGEDVRIQFTPHLVPVNRGILASCYLKGDAQECFDLLERSYQNEPFIQVLPFGALPDMAHVTGSNYCHIGVSADRISGRVLVVSTLDNLCKGSSGQALQNANLMFGLDETLGLSASPVFP